MESNFVDDFSWVVLVLISGSMVSCSSSVVESREVFLEILNMVCGFVVIELLFFNLSISGNTPSYSPSAVEHFALYRDGESWEIFLDEQEIVGSR